MKDKLRLFTLIPLVGAEITHDIWNGTNPEYELLPEGFTEVPVTGLNEESPTHNVLVWEDWLKVDYKGWNQLNVNEKWWSTTDKDWVMKGKITAQFTRIPNYSYELALCMRIAGWDAIYDCFSMNFDTENMDQYTITD